LKTFLHVGCGKHTKADTTAAFAGPDWHELRFDINPAVHPDILGTMTSMTAVAGHSVDALYSAHNIEHLYPHEVPLALAEFARVLNGAGFAVITCPDLQSVAALVAEDKLTDTALVTPNGPVAAIDMLYGYRRYLAEGNHYMAHRCGFTEKVLRDALLGSGFASVATMRRARAYDLWAVACKNPVPEGTLRDIAVQHFPAA